MSDFNFEDFLSGITSTEVTVEVSTVDHSFEIDRLQRMLDALPEDEPKRAAQKSQRSLIKSRIDELRAEENAADSMRFRLRPLTPSEWDDISEQESPSRHKQLEMQCVDPRLSEAQWKKLGEKLGMPRFNLLMAAATELTLREGRSPDFSLSASEKPQG